MSFLVKDIMQFFPFKNFNQNIKPIKQKMQRNINYIVCGLQYIILKATEKLNYIPGF